MKMLFVLEHYHPYLGGAEKLFKQVTESMVESGHQVVVVTTQFQKELPKTEYINGVEVHRVKCYNRFLFTILSLPSVWHFAKNVDFIQTTTYNAALPAWIVGKFRQKKVLLTFHELWGELWFELPYLSYIQRWLYYLYESLIAKLPFYHYIAVSDATKTDLIAGGISEEKISRIHNGINYEKFSQFTPKKTETFSIIYYGRLGVSKGLNILIPAWDQFARSHPTCKLRLVIPTHPLAMYQKIKTLIDNCSIKDSIEIFHDLEEEALFQMVSNAHAVVIPSYKEGFCFVAAEAMALATPIISSGRGALEEVVTGQYIKFEEQTVESLKLAIKLACLGSWKNTQSKKFHLSDAEIAYVNLYENTLLKTRRR